MKKIIVLALIATAIAACNTPTPSTIDVPMQDTASVDTVGVR